MKKKLLYLLFAIIAFVSNIKAQINYSFTATTGTYTPLTGATIINPTALATGAGVGSPSTDDGYKNSVNIGFTFNYAGTAYTKVNVCTNGFISLGNKYFTTSTSTTNPTYYSQHDLRGSFKLDTAIRNIIAPFWTDLDVQNQTLGGMSYKTYGTAPNRVFTLQWKNVLWDYSATSGTLSFQLKLYETTDIIEFIYQREVGTVASDPSIGYSAHASIGITNSKLSFGSFLSVTDTTNNAAVSKTKEYSLFGRPGTGQIYRFTPNTTSINNDIAIVDLYTINTIAKKGSPQPIKTLIVNLGNNTVTNLPVTLNITNANNYSETKTVSSLLPGATATIEFKPFNTSLQTDSLHLGYNDISLSVPVDDDTTNNSIKKKQRVSNYVIDYTDTTIIPYGIVEKAMNSKFATKFYNQGLRTIKKLLLNFRDGGANCSVDIYDTTGVNAQNNTGYPGSLIWTSGVFASTKGAMEISVPSILVTGNFYVVISHFDSTIINYAYEDEYPLRKETFLYTSPTSNGWEDLSETLIYASKFKIGVAFADTTGIAIEGKVFNDFNNNGIKDSTEFYKANIKLELSDGRYTYTNKSGYFQIAVDSLKSYSLTINSPSLYAGIPVSYTHTFNSYDTLVVDNFALHAIQSLDSLDINITSLTHFVRRGRVLAYFVEYENIGTTQISPVINIHYDSSLITYMNCTMAGITNTGTNLNLNIGNILPSQRGNFIIYFNVNITTPTQTIIKTSAGISGGTATAIDSTSVIVIGSYDPNDKAATPVLTPAQVISGKYIDYAIRFQNTGNDTAFRVIIIDTLSSLLQANTLELVSTSHNCNVTIKNGIVFFEFKNILLPDSNVNETASHGFVRFKIKPVIGLADGENVPNQAFIYFDYNSSVPTNTAITQIRASGVLPLQLVSFKGMSLADGNIFLYWNTSSEVNSRNFIVQRSIDGKSFENVGVVNALGYGDNNYNFTVNKIDANIIYFRLMMKDKDGSITYSNVIAIKNSKEETESFILLNNPVKDRLIIKIINQALINTEARIINNQGIVVRTFLLTNSTKSIELNNLSNGLYYLQTIEGSKKIVVFK